MSCKECCSRTVELWRNVSYTVHIRRSNTFEPGSSYGKCQWSIVATSEEFKASIAGEDSCGVGDLSQVAKEDKESNPDSWTSDLQTVEQKIQQDIENHLDLNCDSYNSLAAFRIGVATMTYNGFVEKQYRKNAEFCGNNFNEWL